MGIPVPTLLEAVAREVLRANELSDARMRITITSGSGPAGLARGTGPPTVLVAALPIVPWPPTSTAILSALRRRRAQPAFRSQDHIPGRSAIALNEARDAGADEALLLNTAGNLCEATTANVFLVHDGIAATPPLDSGCLAGITRAHVLELGAVERTMSPDDLLQADEAFLTSSTREIQPLVAIDGRSVGTGEPGPVTRWLADAYSKLVVARSG